MEGYGLKGAPAPVVGNRDIGPDRALLRKKREEEQNQRTWNQQIGRSRKRLTETERAAALQQMQANARTRGDQMVQKVSRRSEDAGEQAAASSGRGASFLKDITTTAHGIGSNETASLSARVAQNRHTNQRLHDSFL